LLELAAPIAQAMGALHQIERSSGAQLGQYVPVALASLQAALAQLQAQSFQHPAVAAALESVAGALATVHALSRAAAAFAAPPQPSPVAQAVPVQPAQQPQPSQPLAQPPQAAPAYPAQAVPHPQAHPAQPPPAQQNFQRAATTPQAAAAAPQAAVQPPRAGGAGKQVAQAAVDMMAVVAELGTHSPSNFYKGLSGNDIIDHGGLFVATYKIPRIGNPVRLKVSMPGGYEFEANAIVRWRREANDAGNDAPPGFGAQFTEITPEARQLVYRYVRNREPLFHDDF
jgi:Tfp pilus assembly protein PilZ